MSESSNLFAFKNNRFLFHYTSFESAVKILASDSIRFGSFSDFNDVAENGKTIIGDGVDEDEEKNIQELFSHYYSISFTKDSKMARGFALETQWGYYGDNGRGVCLVLNKKTLRKAFRKQFGKNAIKFDRIKYIHTRTATSFCGRREVNKEISRFNKECIEDLYFEKNRIWRHEKEYRMLIYSMSYPTYLLLNSDDIIAVITYCKARSLDKIPKNTEYKALLKIVGKDKMFRLLDSMGAMTIVNDSNQTVWTDSFYAEDAPLSIEL